MDVEETCDVNSLLPATFTYYYLSFYLGLLLLFSLWAAHKLIDLNVLADRIRIKFIKSKPNHVNHDVTTIEKILETNSPVCETPETKYNENLTAITTDTNTTSNNSGNKTNEADNTLKKFASKWWKSVYHFKSCYFVTLNHIFDQVTDFAVVIEFIQLWLLEQKYNNKVSSDFDYCPGVNTGLLALWSIVALLLYRLVSAVSIFRLTKDVKRIFLQFFDLELFRTMYVNYINDSTNPCNPQRWIQSLESFLESTPQALIQLYFVIKSGIHNRSVSNTVYVSTLWSIWMVANRAVSEDRLAFKEEYQNASINSWKLSKISRYFCIKKGYLGRLVYRLMDVFYRLCIVLLVWLFIGGLEIGLILFVESMVLVFFCWKTNELSDTIVVILFVYHSCLQSNFPCCFVFGQNFREISKKCL